MLHDDARMGEAWLLAVTDRDDSRGAVAALQAGADDYVQRPFTRTELLARTRAGVRAAQQRSDDTLLRALMVNVPGAIYRSAWHANYTLALISDEIERISGYPPANFIASAKRTLMSIVHPDDRAQASSRGSSTPTTPTARSSSSTGSCAPTARSAGCSTAGSSSRARAAGCGWTARSSTSPSAARPRTRCAGARSRRPAPRSCAPRGRASSRPPTPRGARSSATSTTAPSSGWWRWRSTCAWRGRGSPRTRSPRARSSTSSATSWRWRRPSCASSPAASIPPC